VTVPAQRIQGSKTVADVERQANVALGRINEQIAQASGTGGVPSAEFVALQKEVQTLKNLSGGFADIGGTGAGSPPLIHRMERLPQTESLSAVMEAIRRYF
jgi:hypothetical protein